MGINERGAENPAGDCATAETVAGPHRDGVALLLIGLAAWAYAAAVALVGWREPRGIVPMTRSWRNLLVLCGIGCIMAWLYGTDAADYSRSSRGASMDVQAAFEVFTMVVLAMHLWRTSRALGLRWGPVMPIGAAIHAIAMIPFVLDFQGYRIVPAWILIAWVSSVLCGLVLSFICASWGVECLQAHAHRRRAGI